MKNSYIKINLSLSLSVILISASSALMAGQKSGETEIQSPPLDKIFTIPKTEKTGEEKDKYIAALIDKAISKNIFRNGKSYSFGLTSPILGQTSVSYNGGDDALEYSWSWQQSLNHNIVTAVFNMVTVEKESHYEVTLKCPKKLTSKVRDYSLFGIPQWDLNKISTDVSYACSSAE